MTDLISEEDFSKALKLEKVKLNLLAPALMRLLKLDEVNEIYSQNAELEGAVFAEKMLERVGVEYEISESDIANIPKTDPFILIANHPYGGIDAMILLAIFAKHRPDTKFLANFLLNQIPALQKWIIPVNPFDNVGDRSINQSEYLFK